MPRFSRRQFSFTNGEVSPRVHGRSDMEFYYGGLARCINWLPDHRGNLVRRPGTRFITESKDGQKPHLYDFNVGRDCPVIVEAYPDCFRFIIAREPVIDGGGRLEIPHTYGEDYDKLEYAEDCGALFLAHENHRPSILRKTEDGFSLEAITDLPFDELNQDGDCMLFLEAGGSAPGGSQTITSSQTHAVGDALTTETGEVITIVSVLGNGSYDVSSTPEIVTQQYMIVSVNGQSLITDPNGIPDDGDETNDAFTISAAAGSSCLSAIGCAPFSPEWVGREVRILDEEGVGSGPLEIVGMLTEDNSNEPNTWITVRVTGFTSDTKLTVDYDGDELRATDLWQGPDFVDGVFPETVQTFQDRLWFASENVINASESGDFFGWQPTTETGEVEADNAIRRPITSGRCNDIRWLWPIAQQMLVGTSGGLSSILGAGVSGSFAADAITEQFNESTPAADERPLSLDEGVVYIDATQRELRGATFSQQFNHVGTDRLALFADHIADRKFERVAYQRHPYSIVWGAMGDGTLASLTRVPSQSVRGWSRHELGGSLIQNGCKRAPRVCDVATIYGPNEDTDDLYLVVERTVNGRDVFYIEAIGDFYRTDVHWWEAKHLDCHLELPNITGWSFGDIGEGPDPFPPSAGLASNFAAYDGENWVKYKDAGDGNVQAVAPNTRDALRAGRDWWYDQKSCEWVKLEVPDFGEPEFEPPENSFGFLGLCGPLRYAPNMTELAGLDHLEGERVMSYIDGQMNEHTVANGGIDASGCVVSVGYPMDSTAELLPHRTDLGGTDGANDPQRPVEIAIDYLDAVWVELGNSDDGRRIGESQRWRRIDFPVREIDGVIPFTGWHEAYKASNYNQNDQSNVAWRARGPWPCVIRGIEAITNGSGGR